MELSREKVLALKPSSNSDEVKKIISETTEAVNLIYRCSLPPKIDFQDDKHGIKMLETYGTLSTKSILNFTKILNIANELKKYFNQDFLDKSEYVILSEKIEKLYTNTGIIEKVAKSIVDENTIDDNASKNLATIRKKQKNLEQEIKQKLTNMIHSSNYAKYVQESLITIRNDRYVIPVKEEYRSQIKGFVHDFSSSGSTVFIEPISIFELNNEIANLKVEENIEIENIIKEISKLFYPYIDELKINIEALTSLDFIFAKALYAREVKATEPQINNKKEIILEEARHPLIDPKAVVPITVNLGESYKTLVITGPNTGGKTVTLKTVGLLTCMACSGLHIPAKNTSSIYVFKNIFADIGDDQNIADSLSTFSSHIKNIVNITKNASTNSLVLLDELGSGTDPIEGQALAISILEYLHSKGILTIATTHYQELKKFALLTKDFENASVEFQVETLTPTYRLLIGVPGKSYAFEISKKLGLNESIIENSKKRIDKKDIDFEELVKQIYDDKIQIEREKEEISNELEKVQKLKKDLETKKEEALLKEQEKIENAKIEARNILINAKEEADNIIKELNQLNDNKKANELRKSLNDKIKETISEKEELPEEYENIEPNTNVLVKSLNQEGITASHISKDGEVLVQIGSMKLQVKEADLKIIKKEKQKTQVIVNSNISKSKTAVTEINVIGLTVDEALPIIDKFLDDSLLAKISTVHIIHGKGTGKLRKGIHEFLNKHQHIETYRLGIFGEGDVGFTVVNLKNS